MSKKKNDKDVQDVPGVDNKTLGELIKKSVILPLEVKLKVAAIKMKKKRK